MELRNPSLVGKSIQSGLEFWGIQHQNSETGISESTKRTYVLYEKFHSTSHCLWNVEKNLM